MIGICSAILPSNTTTSTLSFSWSTPFTSEGKHFRKKEYSDCQVRRGKSNVAVGLQLYGPSIAQLIATLISRWDLRLQWPPNPVSQGPRPTENPQHCWNYSRHAFLLSLQPHSYGKFCCQPWSLQRRAVLVTSEYKVRGVASRIRMEISVVCWEAAPEAF